MSDRSLMEDIGEFLYYACCCFMCECCLCCECCPCCAHHRKLVEEGHTRLIESPKLEDSEADEETKLKAVVEQPRRQSDSSQKMKNEENGSAKVTQEEKDDPIWDSMRRESLPNSEAQEALLSFDNEVDEASEGDKSITFTWGDMGDEDEDEADHDTAKLVSPNKSENDGNFSGGSGGRQSSGGRGRQFMKISASDKTGDDDKMAPEGIKEYFAPKTGKEEVGEVEINDRVILFEWSGSANIVAVAGSFNEWTPEDMRKGEDGVFRLQKRLRVGKYVYKFVIDGEWACDEGRETEDDGKGHLNNFINVL